MSAPCSRTAAVFDFDGTLTVKDSFVPFLGWTHGRLHAGAKLVCSGVPIIGYQTGLLSNHQVKEHLVGRFYRGWSVERLGRAGRAFAAGRLLELLNPVALERLAWHQGEGHRICIVSANLEVYLRPWAESQGVEDLLATRLDAPGGVISGRIAGRCCYGPEKLARLEALLGPVDGYRLYVYGDSRGDRDILEVADHAYYRTFTGGRGLWVQ